MDRYACPKCGEINLASYENWADVQYMPILCKECETLYWGPNIEAENCVIGNSALHKKVPNLSEGTPVAIINSEHVRYLDVGVISDRNHIFYRVKFRDDTQIWMPEHWIERVPDVDPRSGY